MATAYGSTGPAVTPDTGTRVFTDYSDYDARMGTDALADTGPATPAPNPAPNPGETPVSRRERKERTRAAIMAAALDLLADESFSSLSLRQLTRAVGIVPTAFYRHFESLEQLGLALVADSFVALREMIRSVRQADPPVEEIIDRSVDVLVTHVAGHRTQFRFIARERYGGVAAVREAIAHELLLFERELATDLSRMPQLSAWTTRDLGVLAHLVVDVMVATGSELVHPTSSRPGAQQEIVDNARTQVRMIVVGVALWQSG